MTKSDNFSHTGGLKRSSESLFERESKSPKTENPSIPAKSSENEKREPLKIKFVVCKTNGYKLFAPKSGRTSQPSITKEQAIYEFHLQRTIAKMRHLEKLQGADKLEDSSMWLISKK